MTVLPVVLIAEMVLASGAVFPDVAERVGLRQAREVVGRGVGLLGRCRHRRPQPDPGVQQPRPRPPRGQPQQAGPDRGRDRPTREGTHAMGSPGRSVAHRHRGDARLEPRGTHRRRARARPPRSRTRAVTRSRFCALACAVVVRARGGAGRAVRRGDTTSILGQDHARRTRLLSTPPPRTRVTADRWSASTQCARDETARASACREMPHNLMFAYTYRVTTEAFRAGWPRDFGSPDLHVPHGRRVRQVLLRRVRRMEERRQRFGRVADRIRCRRSKSVSGLGDMLLGVNAHISRDLPFVLEQVGLVRPDGTSALDDYNLANQILVETQGLALDVAARRFDPDVAIGAIPGLFVGKDGFLALYSAWRCRVVGARRAARRCGYPGDSPSDRRPDRGGGPCSCARHRGRNGVCAVPVQHWSPRQVLPCQ